MSFASALKTSAAHVAKATLGLAAGFSFYTVLAWAGPAHAAEAMPAASITPTAEAAAKVPMAKPGSGPKLWVIKDADSTVYLFGTVHVLKPGTAWGAAKVDKAFASAQDVYFEVANLDDVAAAAAIFQSHGFSPDRPLSGLLSDQDVQRLDTAAKAFGSSAKQLDPMRPWMAGLNVGMLTLAKSGYDPKSGVDPVLLTRARAAGKPIKGLETMDIQVRMLAEMSDTAQVAFLKDALDTVERKDDYLGAIVDAWAAGDVDGVDRLMVKPMKAYSLEVNDAFLTRRNTSWADQIQTILAGKGTTFIAVGAAHLAGEDSVQSILAKRGVKAELVKN